MMNRTRNFTLALSLLTAAVLTVGLTSSAAAQQPAVGRGNAQPDEVRVFYKSAKVGGLDIFYREAGSKDAPTLLLLHGFPTSSQMFRNLLPALADQYHVVAPDYPGYGHSSMPSRGKFAYTFDNLAKVIDEFTEQLGLKKMPSTCRTTGLRSATDLL
jgi:predicted alpha/beta-fold hydrolase